MCCYVCVIMHVKDPQLSVVSVGHGVPLAGFCLSLYGLHVLNRDVNMIKKIYLIVHSVYVNVYVCCGTACLVVQCILLYSYFFQAILLFVFALLLFTRILDIGHHLCNDTLQ